MCAFTDRGDWQLDPSVRNKFLVSLDQWTNWTEDQKRKHFDKFCKYQHNKEAPKTVTDKDNLIEVSKTAGQVKRKENQTTRVRSTVTRNTPNASRKRKGSVVQNLDAAAFQELRAKMAKSD